MTDEDLRWCDVCDDCSHYKAVGDEKYQCTLEGGRCRGYFAYKKLKAENAALRERLEKAVELPCRVGDTIYSLDRIDLKIRGNKVIAITFLLSNSVNHLEVQAHNFRGAVASFESIDFGRYVFINRADAEARIAELKGEKK